jgi:hypothetical protein
MTFDEIKQFVKKGECPSGMRDYELLALQNLSELLTRFYRCSITQEDGAALAVKIEKAFEQHKANYESLTRHVEYLKKVESANSAYRLSDNHTPEADRLSDTILGLERGKHDGN